MKEKIKFSKSQIMTIVLAVTLSILMSFGTSYASNNYLYNSNDVSYDNTVSGITATDVQGAVDELYFHATDYSGINTRLTTVENQIYPVGSIYISVNNTNPSTIFGGTWESFGTGRTLVGVDTSQSEFDTIEKTGGNKIHQHVYGLQYGSFYYATVIENSAYAGLLNYSDGVNYSVTGPGTSLGTNLQISSNSSFNQSGTARSTAHYRITANTSATSSLQPYITVYMWKRTA